MAGRQAGAGAAASDQEVAAGAEASVDAAEAAVEVAAEAVEAEAAADPVGEAVVDKLDHKTMMTSSIISKTGE